MKINTVFKKTLELMITEAPRLQCSANAPIEDILMVFEARIAWDMLASLFDSKGKAQANQYTLLPFVEYLHARWRIIKDAPSFWYIATAQTPLTMVLISLGKELASYHTSKNTTNRIYSYTSFLVPDVDRHYWQMPATLNRRLDVIAVYKIAIVNTAQFIHVKSNIPATAHPDLFKIVASFSDNFVLTLADLQSLLIPALQPQLGVYYVPTDETVNLTLDALSQAHLRKLTPGSLQLLGLIHLLSEEQSLGLVEKRLGLDYARKILQEDWKSFSHSCNTRNYPTLLARVMIGNVTLPTIESLMTYLSAKPMSYGLVFHDTEKFSEVLISGLAAKNIRRLIVSLPHLLNLTNILSEKACVSLVTKLGIEHAQKILQGDWHEIDFVSHLHAKGYLNLMSTLGLDKRYSPTRSQQSRTLFLDVPSVFAPRLLDSPTGAARASMPPVPPTHLATPATNVNFQFHIFRGQERSTLRQTTAQETVNKTQRPT